ncbi:MAG TPA: type IV pilin N-terminal domain-containing protein [Methanoregulaceae archaeon]|nr:type IV pilin N-terminal domain-containing protein [Methanoregulaceae archaeon]
MKAIRNEEEAVSPVIGVILMVAIVVILAAVIAAFVFGMTGGVTKAKNIAVTGQLQGGNIVLTYQGGQDSSALAGLVATSDQTTAGTMEAFDTPFQILTDPVVGDTATTAHSSGATPRKDHVVVVATFTDGSQQVVLDTTM